MKTEAIYITKKNVQCRTISQMILNSKFIGLVAEVLSMIENQSKEGHQGPERTSSDSLPDDLRRHIAAYSCCPACLDGACSISMQNVIT